MGVSYNATCATIPLHFLNAPKHIVTFAHVICQPTEQEDNDYLEDTTVKNADEMAVDKLIALQFAFAQSFPLSLLASFRKQMAARHGGYLLMGTPQQVANGTLLLHEAGFNGATFTVY